MLLVGIATAFTIISMAPAGAGGSWLDPSWVRVEAGEHIELSGFVSHGQLGWIEDGPFYAYLRGDTYGEVITEGFGGTETDVPLGKLNAAAQSTGIQVSADFVLPTDMPPGEYWVLVCNDPCTTGLGDLIGGVIYVGVDPPSREEEITSIRTNDTSLSATSVAIIDGGDTPSFVARYASLSPYPSRSVGLSPAWIAMSVTLTAVVLLAAVATRQRTGPR